MNLLEITGPALQATRQSDGSVEILGISTVPHAPAAADSAAPGRRLRRDGIRTGRDGAGRCACRCAQFSLPPMEIDRFTWKDISLMLDDQSTTPANRIGISKVGFTLKNLRVRAGEQGSKAGFEAFLNAPGLVENITFKGQLSPRLDNLGADWTVHAEGISKRALCAYLGKAAGQDRQNGTFDANFTTSLGACENGLQARFAMRDARYADGPRTASLAELDASG